MAKYGAVRSAALHSLRNGCRNTKQIGAILPLGRNASTTPSSRAILALRALEARGLVVRLGCTEDDGAILWEITEAGRAALNGQ